MKMMRRLLCAVELHRWSVTRTESRTYCVLVTSVCLDCPARKTVGHMEIR